jgi:hypothetical protein
MAAYAALTIASIDLTSSGFGAGTFDAKSAGVYIGTSGGICGAAGDSVFCAEALAAATNRANRQSCRESFIFAPTKNLDGKNLLTPPAW